MSEKLIDLLILTAKQEEGVREGAKNNTGARIVDYQGATWLAPGAWPWCAAFTSWVMREWLELQEVRDEMGFNSFSVADKWRCRDASAFGWEKWAVQHQIKIFNEKDKALKGDFVTFDFSHIGIVVEDQPDPAAPIHTIEGNTNFRGTRESNSGDGVWMKTRAPSLVKSYIRIFS